MNWVWWVLIGIAIIMWLVGTYKLFSTITKAAQSTGKSWFKIGIEWASRHVLWIALGGVALWLLTLIFDHIEVIFRYLLFLTISVSAVTGLSMMALYAYTWIDFTDKMIRGEDKRFNSIEQNGMYRVIGNVFIGVALIAGIIFLAMYQTEIFTSLNGE